MARLFICLIAALLCVGCAHFPVNGKLAALDPRSGFRFENFPASAENSDELFVVLAMSGGGARAAAFSYGVLEELRRTPITFNGRTTNLLSEVDVLAPASGSGITAAYYALHHERAFDTFPQRFLAGNFQAKTIGAAANPFNWPRLTSPTFDRIDLVAEAYDRDLYDGGTFGDLLKNPRRPFLLLTATDYSLGRRFEFTQEQFDCLHSDLATVPLARAVAASAAFPIAMNPLTLENYSQSTLGQPAWIEEVLNDPTAPAALRTRARDLRSYADGTTRKHIRLVDGAISDYSGLRTIIEAYTSTRGDFSIRRLVEAGRIKKFMVISVNAVRTPGAESDASVWTPNWVDVLYMTASEPIRNRAYDTIAEFREMLARERASGTAAVESEFVTVEFAGVPDEALRERLERIPTSLSLTAEESADLRRAASEALQNSKEFQGWLQRMRQ